MTTRPCAAWHPDPVVTAGRCFLCRLAVTDPRHAARWGEAVAGGDPGPFRPPGGPGTELKALLADLGFGSAGGCGCGDRAAQMDAWGPAGCRERREEVVGWLRERLKEVGWGARLRGGVAALRTGVLSIRDPIGFLVDEAVRRAEAKEATDAKDTP